ncbi:hypothetical protein ACX80V_15125 [Arthrobacter sp. MDT3-24]
MEYFVGARDFLWDEEQKQMAKYLQDPLQFVQQETGRVPSPNHRMLWRAIHGPDIAITREHLSMRPV